MSDPGTHEFADPGHLLSTDPAVPASHQAQVQAGLDQLKASDPQFDGAAFLDLARTAFFKVKLAWQARQPDLAQGYVTDGLLLALEQQTADMTQQHVRNVLEGLTVQDEHVVDAAAGDHVTVRFDALAAHYAVDDAGQLIFGERIPKPFTEFWQFVRPAGSRSVAAGQAECANCGAPIAADDSGRCRYCRAVIATGTLGWRVAEIKEELDWE